MARVLITTGGTGGHVFPALATAEALYGHDLLFVGSDRGPEKKWATDAGLPFYGLAVRGILGRGFAAIGASWAMVLAFFQALFLLRRWKPDVVAGFGGYASFAPLLAAWVLRIPIVIHEQNAFAGLSNKVLGKLAQTICLSFESESLMQTFEASRCVFTGNPVRSSIIQAMKKSSLEQASTPGRRLLVMGGSQGAKAINSLVLGGLERLRNAEIEIWHQSGKADFERVRAGYCAFAYDRAKVEPFIDQMDVAYAWADLVLCRAGASTVAELAIAGKAALFIPFPYATHDHQMFNAKAVAKNGAALVVDERHLTEHDVIGTLLSLFEDGETISTMHRAALALARPEAAQAVAREILTAGRVER